MKKIILLVSVAATINYTAIAQWTLQTSGLTTQLQSVYCTDANNCYTVGQNGVILKTTNGGTNWNSQTSGTTNELYSVFFTSSTTGYTVGDLGAIKKTTNSGSTWTDPTSGLSDNFEDVFFISSTTGYTISSSGIRKTTNSGSTWTLMSSSESGYDIHFTNSSTGYLVYNSGVVKKTTNSGSNWTSLTTGVSSKLLSVFCTDANTCYVVGFSGTIIKTTNGGTNWNAQTSGVTVNLRSVYCTDANTCYTVGDGGTVLKTTDGGTSWGQQTSSTTSTLLSVFFADANTGYAVSAGGKIIKTTNGGGTACTNSTAATSASASASTVCSGSSTTLSVSGGTLGTGASWYWYSSSCGGTYVGTGTSVSVSPTTATTYYVRAEGTCNTTGCVSVTVNVNSNSTSASSAIASPSSVCSGSSTTLSVSGGSLGSGASWMWYTGSCGGVYAGSGSSISVSPISPTDYYLRAEGTCNTTSCISVFVAINTTPSIPVSTSATNTGSTSFTANWNAASGATTYYLDVATNASFTAFVAGYNNYNVGNFTSQNVTGLSTGTTYYYRVRSGNSCGTSGNSASQNITLCTSSTAATSAIASVNPVCSGSSTTLSISGGTLGTDASWKWYSGSCAGTLVGTGASVSVFPTTATTYYVRAEGTCNNTGCVSVTVSVNTNSTAASSLSASPSSVCAGYSTTLSISGGTLGTGANWNWYIGSCGGSSIGTGSSISVTPTANTTYYVRAEGSCNVTSCVSVTVNVNTTSTAASSASASPSSVCAGSSATLSVSGGTLGTGANWNWYTGNCGGTLVGTGTSVSVSPAASTTYYVWAVGTCNTSSCVPVTVDVFSDPAPVITPSGATTFCQGGSVTLTSSAANSYSWSNGISTQEITVAASGTYTVTVTNSIGCTGYSSPITITVNPNPIPTITTGGATTFCQGGSVTLTSSAANSYSWSNGILTQENTITTSGSYLVTVTNANGCSGVSSPVTVTVNQNPTPVITACGATTFCQGGNVTLVSSSANAYSWSTGNSTQSITVGASGNYIVTVTDANGCTGGSSPATVTVNPNPTPIITAGGATTFCQGESVTLTSSSANSYLWSTGETTQNITIITSGNYSVTVTENGCAGSSSVTSVTVNSPPSPPISSDTSVCEGFVVPDLSASGTNVQWYADSTMITLVATGNIFATGQTSVGVFNYYATETQNGCESPATTVTLTIFANPVTPVISQNGTDLSCSENAIFYEWFLNGNPVSNCTSQTCNCNQDGSYTVVITDLNGCSSSSLPFNAAGCNVGIEGVDFSEKLFSIIPNPNTGKFIFKMGKTEKMPNKITIYNVLGEKIYSSSKESSSSFTIDISKQPRGIYYVQVETGVGFESGKVVIE